MARSGMRNVSAGSCAAARGERIAAVSVAAASRRVRGCSIGNQCVFVKVCNIWLWTYNAAGWGMVLARAC